MDTDYIVANRVSSNQKTEREMNDNRTGYSSKIPILRKAGLSLISMNGSHRTPIDGSLMNCIAYANDGSSAVNVKTPNKRSRIPTRPVRIGDVEVKVSNRSIRIDDVRAVNSINRSENPASRLRSDADNGGRRSAGNDSARRIVSCTRMSITRYSALAPTSCSGKAPEKIITPPNADDDGVAKVAAVSSDNGGVDSNVEYRTNLMALRRRMKSFNIAYDKLQLLKAKIADSKTALVNEWTDALSIKKWGDTKSKSPSRVNRAIGSIDAACRSDNNYRSVDATKLLNPNANDTPYHCDALKTGVNNIMDKKIDETGYDQLQLQRNVRKLHTKSWSLERTFLKFLYFFCFVIFVFVWSKL